MFVYGTGIARYQLVRSGTPAQKAFCLCSTMAMDVAGNVLANFVNDPNYVRSHIQNWRVFSNSSGECEVDISADSATTKLIKDSVKNSFLPDDRDKISDWTMEAIFDLIRPYIQPVQVDYSHELLASQIQGIGLMALIVALIVIGLLVFLLINIFIYMNSSRILAFFTNKYVHLYVDWQLKFLAVEIILSSLVIIYGMGMLVYALHFIVTHPLT